MHLTALWMAALLAAASLCAQPDSRRLVWLDADTGNEMDDLYAIARLVLDTSVRLAGLSSAHFNNADLNVFERWNGYAAAGLVTVEESQRLNAQLLAALGRTDIPHPLGADRQTGRAWGQSDPRDSPAAQALIAAVRSLPPGRQLDVVTLGPLTNAASALQLAPDILPHIRIYALGARYDPRTRVWNKSEFNIRNDLNAFDYVLNLEGLDLTVMPLEAAFPLQFRREDTYARLDERIGIERILEDRWREHNPQDEMRIMWDLALVEAYLNPAQAEIRTVRTPPENTRRRIRAYVEIDAAALAADFWKVLKSNSN
ncbi:MAG: nucleoside hydrolase [Bacteroidia bacterium]|nr:nucleoside hydrolase [Bacteroidia bacterium]